MNTVRDLARLDESITNGWRSTQIRVWMDQDGGPHVTSGCTGGKKWRIMPMKKAKLCPDCMDSPKLTFISSGQKQLSVETVVAVHDYLKELLEEKQPASMLEAYELLTDLLRMRGPQSLIERQVGLTPKEFKEVVQKLGWLETVEARRQELIAKIVKEGRKLDPKTLSVRFATDALGITYKRTATSGGAQALEKVKKAVETVVEEYSLNEDMYLVYLYTGRYRNHDAPTGALMRLLGFKDGSPYLIAPGPVAEAISRRGTEMIKLPKSYTKEEVETAAVLHADNSEAYSSLQKAFRAARKI